MIIEPSLTCNYQSDRNKTMALCALYLAQFSAMLSTTMKSTAMKRHLRVASSVPLSYTNPDHLLDTHGLEAQCIKDVLSEVKRWDYMLNRREPVIVKMVLYVHKKCTNKHADSLELVPYD